VLDSAKSLRGKKKPIMAKGTDEIMTLEETAKYLSAQASKIVRENLRCEK